VVLSAGRRGGLAKARGIAHANAPHGSPRRERLAEVWVDGHVASRIHALKSGDVEEKDLRGVWALYVAANPPDKMG
jgi:hypothetical protein